MLADVASKPACACYGIMRRVLTVTVHRYRADYIGTAFKDVGKRGLERRALTSIDLVREQGRAGQLPRLCEILFCFLCASVVYEDDAVEARSMHLPHSLGQMLTRIERGNNDRYPS